MRSMCAIAATVVSTLLLAGLTARGGSSDSGAKVTASDVVAKLKAAGLPITDIAEVTAANDPNRLLGRPGGYASKETFTDTRVNKDGVKDDASRSS